QYCARVYRPISSMKIGCFHLNSGLNTSYQFPLIRKIE
ncbi:MAG: hypothetical protein ACI86P_002540, partial [Flavobacteriales bacterium]